MNNESKQLLRDENIKPTDKIMADGLKNAWDAYKTFIQELKHYDITLMDYRYYNDGKAWLSKGEYKWLTTRGTKKVKPIFWLSIWEGFFKISFFFAKNIQNDLMNLSISDEAKEIIKNAKAMGKTMKFIPVIFDVTDNKQLNDIYILAKYKKEKL